MAAGICLQVKIWLRVINIIKGPTLHCGAVLAPWSHCKWVWWIQGIHRATSSISPSTHVIQLFFAVLSSLLSVLHLSASPLTASQHSEVITHCDKWESKIQTEGVCWQCAFNACQLYKLRHQQLQVPHPAQITVGQRQKQILWHLRDKLYRLVLKPLSIPEGKLCCTRYFCASVSLSLSKIFQWGLSLSIYTHVY